MIFLCFMAMISIKLSGVYNLNFVPVKEQDPSMQIRTAQGMVQGVILKTYRDQTFYAFLGIPYAEKPLGKLRFKDSVPKSKWTKLKVLDARLEKDSCMEGIIIPQPLKLNGTSEDCLYLNVYVPQIHKSNTTLMPVLVYIHGGAFLSGGNKMQLFGPDYLMDQDIVVVAPNYRTGIFGFLSLGIDEVPGNMGLKDQVLALKWVQENIKHFGGDPNLVTLYGISAGAVSVNYHMLSPLSKGLFHRVVGGSGTVLSQFSVQKQPKVVNNVLSTILGVWVGSPKMFLDILRNMSANALLTAQFFVLLSMSLLDFLGSFPFLPVIEHNHAYAFITESSMSLLEKGKFTKVPYLTGFTTHEMGFFQSVFPLLTPFLSDGIGSLVIPPIKVTDREAAYKDISHFYFSGRPLNEVDINDVEPYLTDSVYIRPLRKCSELIWKYIPLYVYQFAYVSDYGLKSLLLNKERLTQGPVHAEDMFYLWKQKSVDMNDPKDELIKQRYVKILINFMKYGNPTPEEDPLFENIIWPRVNSSLIPYLRIDTNLSVVPTMNNKNMSFWDQYIKKFTSPPYITY